MTPNACLRQEANIETVDMLCAHLSSRLQNLPTGHEKWKEEKGQKDGGWRDNAKKWTCMELIKAFERTENRGRCGQSLS